MILNGRRNYESQAIPSGPAGGSAAYCFFIPGQTTLPQVPASKVGEYRAAATGLSSAASPHDGKTSFL
jgi:hypothetical protein